MFEQLTEAALLMSVGMTVVFCFLILLLGGIHAIALYVAKFPGSEEKHIKPLADVSKTVGNHDISPNVVAAISAAIRIHRKNKNK